MARNLVSNGGFYDDLTGWTVANATHVDGRAYAFVTSGACKLDATVGDAYVQQTVTVPGSGIRRARLVVRAWGAEAAGLVIEAEDSGGGTVHHDGEHGLEAVNTWNSLVADFTVEGGDEVVVTITLDHETYEKVVYIDDVQLFMVDPAEASAEGLALELMRRRSDPANILHSKERYLGVVNEAIAAAPLRMWRLAVSVSVTTTATAGDPVRRYSLATVSGLDFPAQVRRVWMEGSDDQNYQIGRWEVEDDEGALTLVLDDDPAETGRVVRVEFLAPHGVLDTLDFDDTTELDREWLLREAMVRLLMEADEALEDPGRVDGELQKWDQLRQGREVEVLGRRRRPAGKVRGIRW